MTTEKPNALFTQELQKNSLTGIENSADTPFMTMAKFAEYIEQIVLKHRVDYMQAVLIFCKENSLEPEDVSKFVSSNLKSKIEASAIESGYLPKKPVVDL